jgi:hypothetical protein
MGAAAKFKEADSLFRSGRYQEAMQVLVELDRSFPHTKNILFPMALCLEKLGCPGEAEQMCDRLIAQFGDQRAVQMKARLGKPQTVGHAGSGFGVNLVHEDVVPAGTSPNAALNEPPGVNRLVHGFTTWPASCVALIVTNLIPLAGAVFFGWSVFVILFSCWMENAVTGAFNALRMAVATGGKVPGALKSILIPFFVFHYGVFTVVHGGFIVAFFSGLHWTPIGPGRWKLDSPLPTLTTLHNLLPAGILIVLAGMIVSHGVSFVTNFIRNGEFRRVSVLQLFLQPYSRVAVLHITILLGGFAVLYIGANQLAVAALVLLKTVFDLYAHLSERKKYAQGSIVGQGS